MNFITDRQTLNDLNILGGEGRLSIYNLFNHTKTAGGAKLLEQMFQSPLSDRTQIDNRSKLIFYFAQHKITFNFKGEWFDSLEQYLANSDNRSKMPSERTLAERKISSLIGTDTEYRQTTKAIYSLFGLSSELDEVLKSLQKVFGEQAEDIRNIFDVLNLPGLTKEKLTYEKIVELDILFRFKHNGSIKKLLFYIYQLDVFIAVAQSSLQHNLTFAATCDTKKQRILEFNGVFHPLVSNAIGNDLDINGDKNVVFLTGANMAGKSTFMKSLGIAIYLAHMGFPVPARQMRLSTFNGIFTTINLSDDINAGASHFYAEVLRIKKLANEIAEGKNLFIIFDELFRGTNVKDAYDATIAITTALSGRHNCVFIISTHIIEAGFELKKQNDHIQFVYLPTDMVGDKPKYSYTLHSGITEDRHGMTIIKNEGILNLLETSINNSETR